MAGRKIRDEADARACLAAAARAGVRRRDWARAHGVDGRSLHCWYLRLRGPGGRLKPSRESTPLVELVPAFEMEEARSVGEKLLVRLNGVEIEVSPDFDADALARLLDVVSRC